MSATVHAANHTWAHVHRAARIIVLLSLALPVALGLLGAGSLAGPDAVGLDRPPPAGRQRLPAARPQRPLDRPDRRSRDGMGGPAGRTSNP